MFSLPQGPSAGLVFFNLVLLFLVFLLQKRALKAPFVVSKTNRMLSIVIMFVFVLFSFWGEDWFHYLDAYPDLCQGYRGHLEDVYVWIAQHLSVGYISFRFAIWGTGLIFLLLTIERLPIKKDLIILFFGSFWIIWFSYARVSLGLAIGFWGLAVLYNPYRNRFLSKLIAISAIVVSYYFHKSAFVFIVVIVLTILSFRLKKQLFVPLLVISIPFVLLFISRNASSIFMMDADVNEGSFGQSLYFGQQYLKSGQESKNRGNGELFATILGSIPYYLILLQSIFLSIKQVNIKESIVIQIFIRFFTIMIPIATLFLLNIGVNSMVLYVRFLRFAAFPCAVLLAFFWECQYYPKLTKWTFYLSALSTLYSVGYSLYLKL